MTETRNPTCEEVRAALPALADGDGMSLAMRRHLSRCPGCSEELEVYRELRAATAQLATAVASPPPGLKDALVTIPSGATRLDEVRSHVARHRRAYAGGVALALGATGAALWRRRRLVTA
jgi:anti-sigma factor RsiW